MQDREAPNTHDHGMLAGHRRYIDDVLRVKSNMDSGMFKPLQEAAALALSAPDEWYARLNEVYGRRRRHVEEIMDELGCSYNPSQSGLFLWGKIPGRYDNAEELTEELLHRNHLFVTPGSVFGDNGSGHIRISLCAEEETMKKALLRIRTGTKTEVPTIN